jgi:intracellular protein transport protein USO1
VGDRALKFRFQALETCADVIRGNPSLQESFAHLQVPPPLPDQTESEGAQANGVAKVYVIDGLLDLTLSVASMQAFDLRLAACECLKAYFSNHSDVRLHFLRRAIEGHKFGVDETANVLTVLLRPSAEALASDPYRLWFAAVIMFHLLYSNPAAKALAMTVTEGDEASGEEVITSIQTITAQLTAGLNRDDNPRVLVGYLMLLLGWLFEDMDGVNDFLGEGSNVQSLVQVVVQPRSTDEIVQSLCAMLLGVVYEFSTKDSPIPRATLQPVLMTQMGRDRYLDALAKLRKHPLVRYFEVLPQKLDTSSPGKLPDVFFDGTFVDFLYDNFNRLGRAIDRDAGMEISVVTNGIQKGISRELVDSLRGQVSEKERAVQRLDAELASLGQRLDQEQGDHRRTRDELSRSKATYEANQRQREDDVR